MMIVRSKTSRRRPRGYSKRKANFIVLDPEGRCLVHCDFAALTIPQLYDDLFHIPKQNIIRYSEYFDVYSFKTFH